MSRNLFSLRAILVVTIFGVMDIAAGPVFADLVPLGAQWRYLDDGSDQATAWREAAFDDSSWSVGPAQLGYGDGDEATVLKFGSDSSAKYTTAYFRHQFNVTSLPTQAITLDVLRDDGVVVYLNGEEIFRDNMPDGIITSSTFAESAGNETVLQSLTFDPAPLVVGTNTLAVEIHQVSLTSSDISFDLSLSAKTLLRGPYLQQGSEDGVTVRWRTAANRDAVVRYGTDASNLDQQATGTLVGTDHAVTLSGLTPGTRYYYRIGDSLNDFGSSEDQYFDTHPVTGEPAPTRIWVLGDSGTANSEAASVRDAFFDHNEGPHSDVWLMLGDNAYNDGTDAQYQTAVFDFYPQALSNSILWPTLGNHDGHSADSSTQSGPYYDIFTLPANGESGGVASGTEAYYSFDYANIHFISLDSYETDRSATGAMATWLQADLSATNQEWIIAFWHHPPYSKGSHDSDRETPLIEMRENFLPMLELYGVDLVLSGHSHSYERSMLIDGHYGQSDNSGGIYINDGDGTPDSIKGAYSKPAKMNSGSVYAVAGSSGKTSAAPLNHPVMISNLLELGSMVIDVNGNQLDAVFLDSSGVIRDSFKIVHQTLPASPPASPDNLVATTFSTTEISLGWSDNSLDETGFDLQRSLDRSNWESVATPGSDTTGYMDIGLDPGKTYHYRILAGNNAGFSAPSNTSSATTEVLPALVSYGAYAETRVSGSISGNVNATELNDGSVQSITEIETRGKPSRRQSQLAHIWHFSIQPGVFATVHANVWSSGSSDGDRFDFTVSQDGGANWQELFTVSSTSEVNEVSALLAPTDTGSVLIRVLDTDRTPNHRALDTIYIDELRIQVGTVAGSPPDTPDGLGAVLDPMQGVVLNWKDNASDEAGYVVQRQVAGSGWINLNNLASDTIELIDAEVLPYTTYNYRVQAFSTSGSSTYSDTVAVTTGAVTLSNIALTTSSTKIKGVVHVNVSWQPAYGDTVNIVRDSVTVSSVSNTTSYTDDTGLKRGATFVYKICESDDPGNCSDESTITF